MMAFRLSRVRAFARIQQNMDLPLPGLPQTAVSYTHLDVYKRQGIERESAAAMSLSVLISAGS